MPGYDGAGPRGQGPMTGGGRGRCASGWSQGGLRGFGFRRTPYRGMSGPRRWWNGASTAYEQPAVSGVDALAEQIDHLTERVESLYERLETQERSGT